MSLRTSRAKNSKKFSTVAEKDLKSLLISISKVNCNQPSPYEAGSPRGKKVKSSALQKHPNPKNYYSFKTCSNASPFASYKTNHTNITDKKFSEMSQETFEKFSLLDLTDSSKEITLQSPVVTSSKKLVRKSSDSVNDLESCRREIGLLKEKIFEMEKKSSKNLNQNSTQKNYQEKNINAEVQRQINKLIKQHQIELEQQKIALIEEYTEEFDSIHSQIVTRLKKQQKRILMAKEKELEEKYRCEIALIQKENEAKLKLKLIESNSEYERKNNRLQEENNWLKKEVEKLKGQLEDTNAKNEIEQKFIERNFQGPRNFIQENNDYNRLFNDYNLLQKDYLRLKKNTSTNEVLCSKCKAFAQRDEDLSKKINSLKEYLNS